MGLKQKILDQVQFSRLLIKEVLDTLTNEEKAKLEKWKLVKPNKELYNNIFDYNNRQERDKIANDIDLSKEWKVFINNWELEKDKSKPSKKIQFYSIAASVAAIFIFAAILIIKPGRMNNEQSEIFAEAISIAPGQIIAELILEDGEIIDLESVKSTVIQDDEIIISNDYGILEYKNLEKNNKSAANNILRVPRGGEYQLILGDSTVVWLNSETQLTYPVNFSQTERKVELIGEAYFEVAKDKARPFVVVSNQQEVKVLGTAFNISAYPNEEKVFTTLAEGSVEVSVPGDDNKLKRTEVIKQNQQLVYGRTSNSVELIEVNSYLYTSWKDGRFVFRNEPLVSIMNTLSRWYDIDVRFEEKDIEEIKFTGDLKRYSDLADLLKILEVEMSVRTEILDDNSLIIKR